MSILTDFHSHVLPRIDDGSASLKESIAMLRAEADQGIRHVVATPHFYAHHDSPERFLARRYESEMRLREAMEKVGGLPQLSVGAEVYFFPGICHSDLLPDLTIDGKTCILIEMPNAPWSDSMYRELEEIETRRGLIPIVAHVDRYIRPLRTHRIPERLAQLPVYVQANASFFLQPQNRRLALKLLREEKIQLLGSDCHNMTSRLPNLGEAGQVITQHCGREMVRRINDLSRSLLEEELYVL